MSKEDNLRSLKDMEISIVYMVCLDWKNERIADTLNRSPKTINNHLTKIYNKFNIQGDDKIKREKFISEYQSTVFELIKSQDDLKNWTRIVKAESPTIEEEPQREVLKIFDNDSWLEDYNEREAKRIVYSFIIGINDRWESFIEKWEKLKKWFWNETEKMMDFFESHPVLGYGIYFIVIFLCVPFAMIYLLVRYLIEFIVWLPKFINKSIRYLWRIKFVLLGVFILGIIIYVIFRLVNPDLSIFYERLKNEVQSLLTLLRFNIAEIKSLFLQKPVY